MVGLTASSADRVGLSFAVLFRAMAHRQFRDSIGRTWDVWSVIPERAERRAKHELALAGDRRRREAGEVRVKLGEQWTHGWLAFETPGEKRRLAPIPDHWEGVTDVELESMRDRATPIVRVSPRLAE